VPFLVWDSPQGRVVFELTRSVIVIGRDDVADLKVDETTVSRRHALLQLDGETVRLTDLGSTSGTKINGASLVRDVPSTLEPGDFLALGRAILTFHHLPPPAASKPAPVDAPAPKPVPRPAAPARPPRPKRAAAEPRPKERAARELPWKWIALMLAFLLVGMLGAVIALQLAGDRKETVVVREPAAGEQAPPPEAEPETPAEPEPPAVAPEPEEAAAPSEPRAAPAGAIPPAQDAPVADFPQLLELDGGASYCPVEVRDWDATSFRVIGADGLLYTVPRRRLTRIVDRADLERRAALDHERLAPDDADGRWEQAQRCAKEHLPARARKLLTELLAIRPDDGRARALLQSLGTE